MIRASDNDVVGAGRILIDTAQTILESLVRHRTFDQSDLEWISYDVDKLIRQNTQSDTAVHLIIKQWGECVSRLIEMQMSNCTKFR